MAYEARGRRRGGAVTAATANSDTLRFPLAGAGAGPASLTFPLTVFGLHWLVVQLAASISYLFGTPNETLSPPYRTMPPPLAGLAHLLVEPLRQWDGLWYKLIAEQGYGDPEQIARAAFWPLYPWLMRLGSDLTGWTTDTIGYLVANAAFAGALVLLYRLVSLDFDAAVARRAVVALAFFPTAFFFQAVYTESLFLLLVVGALLAARQDRWWLAGLVGALAALTRSYGVLLGLPFAVLLFQRHRLEIRQWFPNALFAALPLLGPAVFGWHLDRVQDNWRAWADVQLQWNRYQAAPWDTMRCAVEGCFYFNSSDGAEWTWLASIRANPTWQTLISYDFRVAVAESDTLELAVTLLFLVLAVIGLRKLPPYQSAYLLPGLVIPLFQPSQVHALMSMPRFGLTLFPLFVVLALLLRSRVVALPALALSTLLLVFLTSQFALWYWVS